MQLLRSFQHKLKLLTDGPCLLGQVYNYKYDIKRGNVGEIFSEDSLNEIFGVKRLYSSLTQVYSAKRKQRWRSLIDDIFN